LEDEEAAGEEEETLSTGQFVDNFGKSLLAAHHHQHYPRTLETENRGFVYING
jgi:hypothetical protein